jgi:hypothetical protein
MTRDKALIGLYSIFHVSQLSADVNLIGLHKILDDLIAAEREACAKFVEDWSYPKECAGCDQPTPQQYAQAIRARGEVC